MVDYPTISIMIAATSVVIGVINSILSSRREERRSKTTLDTRQAQLFMQIYNHFSNPEFQKQIHYLHRHVHYENYEDFNEKLELEEQIDEVGMVASAFAFFEGVGVLVEDGLIDVKIVNKLLGSNIVLFWEKFGPLVRPNAPKAWDHTEYLYNEIKRIRDRG
jgi:hypothetical protein